MSVEIGNRFVNLFFTCPVGNIEFEVDQENQVVKINATGGGSSGGTIKYSEGLEYTLNIYNSYSVTGIGTCTDTDIVIPATGFMLSLANWYFLRIYKNRKLFSNCSFIATLVITLCAYIWSGFHYEINFLELFAGNNFAEFLKTMQLLLFLYGKGVLLTITFCALSKILSNRYAKMLGKE